MIHECNVIGKIIDDDEHCYWYHSTCDSCFMHVSVVVARVLLPLVPLVKRPTFSALNSFLSFFL